MSSCDDLIRRNAGEDALSFFIGDSSEDDDDRPLVSSLEISSRVDDSPSFSLARVSAAGIGARSMFSSNPSSRLVRALGVYHVLVVMNQLHCTVQ